MSAISKHETNDVSPADSGHDHPKPSYDDVNIPVIFMLGTFSAIMTFVIICFVQGLYYSWSENMVQKDWNSTVLTPQEETIVRQTALRDGFYETKEGKFFTSVDVAGKKLLAGGGDVSALNGSAHNKTKNENKTPEVSKQPTDVGEPKTNASDSDVKAGKSSDSTKAVPPGPENTKPSDSNATDAKSPETKTPETTSQEPKANVPKTEPVDSPKK